MNGLQPRTCATLILALSAALLLAFGGSARGAAADPCAGAPNPVVCENAKPGNPASEWDIAGSGDPTIQGFATEFSVADGEDVSFKIKTDAVDYRVDIYRMGYYGGAGARKVATIAPLAPLPQVQPPCLTDAGDGLVDCGNWAESARWQVPSGAVSGIYFARLVRTDTGGDSHIYFVVRDDDGGSDLLFQTSDTTWQAYNRYGGNSLYVGAPAGRAYKVSYNRPFTTRGYASPSFVWEDEYPMVRWLERNGYDVSYFSGIDSERRGAELLEHEAFLSVGHDEYWSAGQRTNVENARGAGVSLAFFSSNEVFWKTRWESSIDGTGTPHRTLVSYKETHAGAKIDPTPDVDGHLARRALQPTRRRRTAGERTHRPAVHGQRLPQRPDARAGRVRVASALAEHVRRLAPARTGRHVRERDRRPRVRRGRRQRPPAVRPLPALRDDDRRRQAPDRRRQHVRARHGDALADHVPPRERRPRLRRRHVPVVLGRSTASTTTPPAPATRRLTSGSSRHGQPVRRHGRPAGDAPERLVAAAASTDSTRPDVHDHLARSGTEVHAGETLVVSGTASDSGGGVVAGVEVSVDGGATWHPANGTGELELHLDGLRLRRLPDQVPRR